jgi:two-component system, response regulator
MVQEQAILLVEDNDDDAELTRLAFKRSKISNPLVRVSDGLEALDYLFARGAHAGRNPEELPAIVLLDLNLPRLGGLEVLKAIRENERTRHVPVVVLTTSDEEADRLTAYQRYANSYIRKPVNHDEFIAAAKEVGLYWLVLNSPAPPRRG